MVARIGDEVVDRLVHRDANGLAIYGGSLGRNYEAIGVNGFNTEVLFQMGFADRNGINGLTNEALIAVVIDRLKIMNEELPCSENDFAITHLNQAAIALDARMYRRNLMNCQK